MNIFAKIDSNIQFTDSELILIDFIKQQPQQFTQMSVEAIAETCFVSKSSIYRLAKKLAYDGLHELQLMVSASHADMIVHQSNDLDYNYPFKNGDSGLEVLQKMRALYEHAIYISANIIKVYECERVAKLMRTTNDCFIFADNDHYDSSKIFQHKLERIGKRVFVPHGSKNQIATAITAPKGSLVFYISYLPNEKKDFELIRQLKQNQVTLVLVSSLQEHKLNEAGDYNFYFASSEDGYDKISNFATNTSLMFLYDYLFSLYYSLDYEGNSALNRQIYMKERNQ